MALRALIHLKILWCNKMTWYDVVYMDDRPAAAPAESSSRAHDFHVTVDNSDTSYLASGGPPSPTSDTEVIQPIVLSLIMRSKDCLVETVHRATATP